VAATLRSSNSGYSELYFADVADSTAGALSYEHSTNLLRFYNGGSVRATLDSSGNLGLGVTPTNNTLGKTFQIGDRTTLVAQTGSPEAFWLGSNWYYNGGDKYLEDGYATLYSQQSGLHVWFNSPNNTSGTGNPISFTQAMTLDAAGRLLVGATAATAIDERLNVTGRGIVTQSAADTNRALIGTFGGSDFVVGTFDNFAMTFRTNNTERARITSGGDFLTAGKTSASFTTVGAELLANGQINTATANLDNLNIYNTTAAAYRFYVSAAGTVFATNTTISAISDQRFKENVQDLDVGLNAVMALKPRKFDWKAGKGKDIKGDRGFIAQEFEQVFPELIDEWKDPAPEGEEPYKAVRADLIPVLVKAIQEQQAMIETLKAKVAALEAK
jgi:hypothetical protein